MPPSEGGSLPSEGGMSSSKGDILPSESGIAHFCGLYHVLNMALSGAFGALDVFFGGGGAS